MPISRQYTNIVVTDTVNYVIDAADGVLYYRITGTETLSVNWGITVGAGATDGMRCHFTYDANVTLSGNHMFICGAQIPDQLATKDFDAVASYSDVIGWSVRFMADFEESGIVVTADIADDAVTNDKLNNMTRGTIKVGGVSNAPTDLNAKTSGQILIGDGTDILSQPVSGDITITSSGVTTIGALKVTNAKMFTTLRGYVKVGGVGDALSDLNAKTSGYILIGDGTDLKSVQMTGDVTITSGGVTTVNPSILGAALWDYGSMGTHSITSVTAITGCDATANFAFAVGSNSTASGIASVSMGSFSAASGTVSVAIGQNCASSGTNSVSIGMDCIANNTNSIAIGDGATASGVDTISIGYMNVSSGQQSMSFGTSCTASGITSLAMGDGATASATDSIAIGTTVLAKGTGSLALGRQSVSSMSYSRSFSSGMFNIMGDSQHIDFTMMVATTNNVTDYMQLAGGDGFTIPTDCTAEICMRLIAVQTGGAAGTVGDSFSQEIFITVNDTAGVLGYVPNTGASLANYSVVDGNGALYLLHSVSGAFPVAVLPAVTVAANKVQIAVTGDNNKDIQWTAYVSVVWTGHRNFVA